MVSPQRDALEKSILYRDLPRLQQLSLFLAESRINI
jgi:hypothetical protein